MRARELAAKIRSDSRLKDTTLLLMAPSFDPACDPVRERDALFAGCVAKPVLETRLRATLKALVCPRPSCDPAASKSHGDRPGAARKHERARILLAEDNPVNQEVALAILGKLGYSASVVGDGSKAINALQKRDYHVVLMDCEMPELDGFEATRLIRDPATGAVNPRVPIIAVTAGAMAGDRERCLEAGMDDYMSKPLEPEKLEQIIAKWLDRRQAASPPGTPPDSAAAPAAEDSEAAFDGAAFLKRVMGNRALAENVARKFVEDIPVQLFNLRKNLECGDAAGARRNAHTLKGAAAMVSANGLRAVAWEAEQAAAAGRLDTVAALAPSIEQQAERFKAALALAGWPSIETP